MGQDVEGNGRGPFQGAIPALFGKTEIIHAMTQEFREANPRSLLQDNLHCTGIEYSCISWLNVIVRRSKYIFVGLKKKASKATILFTNRTCSSRFTKRDGSSAC